MRLTPLRLLLPALLLLAMAGCGTTQPCAGDEDYLKAQERPRLQLPPDVMASERIAPIEIPPPAADPQKLDPAPRCLDYPPPYFAKKAESGDSAEAAVRAWAAAWAGHKPDVVMQMYSPAFQAPGAAGSAAYLEEREAQVATGDAPSADLQELTVTSQGADRRVVTFVQVFGKERVRRELTLVREGQAWRIIAERTL
jgi:hypothetical protein